MDAGFSIETRDKQPALLLYQTMCIADSVCVFPLSRGPCGGITNVEQSVNREEREVPIPLWIDDNTSLGKRTQKPFFRFFAVSTNLAGARTSSFVATG